MKKTIFILFILVFVNSFSQNKTRETWSFGTGLSHFSMHGDLRSFETGLANEENSFINLGAYLYFDKMINSSFGFEGKINFNKMTGTGQELGGSYTASGIQLSQTRFEGNTFGGEINAIINLSSLFTNSQSSKKRKWNFSTLLGIGMHRYDSKLIDINTNEVIADYGNSPSKNGTTTSMFLTSALALKYKLNANIDLELRQNINVNNDDHLDAAVSDKQALDIFFKTNIGIVFKINDKKHDNYIWQNKGTIITEILKDDDKDGVINKFDLERNTDQGAIVYGNGVAIDSDSDDRPDHKDKCPLIYAKTDDGCIKVKNTSVVKTLKETTTVTDEEARNKITKKEIDSDNDGIPDNLDKCPTIYAKNRDGCPKRLRNDSDRDGILNKDDKCPLTFAQTKNGCPKTYDSDGDGIADKNDKCPTIYAKTNNGCPTKPIPKEKPIPVEPTIIPQPTTIKSTIPIKKTTVETINPELKNLIKQTNQGNLSHGNTIMNNAVNVNSIDISPIYPGCENTKDEYSKKNCMINGISIFVNDNYNTSNAEKINGKVRVLFVVDQFGNTKVAKIISAMEINTKTELKRTIESLPKMTPGKLNNKNTPVKYSLLFDLN